MILSPAQQKIYNDVINAPMYDPSHQWCDIFRLPYDTDCVNGNWNTNTLKAMERKGIIIIVKLGDWWNDVIKLRVN